jgi:hypothetical protein
LNRIIGFLLLSVLLGMGTKSLFSLGKEISAIDPHQLQQSLTLGQEEKIARALAKCERQLGGLEGREYQLYCTLRDRSEPRALIFILASPENRAVAAQAHLRVLLRPRSIWLLDRLPEDWARKAAALQAHVYIVDYDNRDPRPLGDRCDLLANHVGIRVWRYRRTRD